MTFSQQIVTGDAGAKERGLPIAGVPAMAKALLPGGGQEYCSVELIK